jgi:hypothetical protein
MIDAKSFASIIINKNVRLIYIAEMQILLHFCNMNSILGLNKKKLVLLTFLLFKRTFDLYYSMQILLIIYNMFKLILLHFFILLINFLMSNVKKICYLIFFLLL